VEHRYYVVVDRDGDRFPFRDDEVYEALMNHDWENGPGVLPITISETTETEYREWHGYGSA
jgi:hypothetical protein